MDREARLPRPLTTLTVVVNPSPVTLSERISILTQTFNDTLAAVSDRVSQYENQIVRQIQIAQVNAPIPTLGQQYVASYFGLSESFDSLFLGPNAAHQMRLFEQTMADDMYSRLPNIPWGAISDPEQRWQLATKAANAIAAAPGAAADWVNTSFNSLLSAADDAGGAYAVLPNTVEAVTTAIGKPIAQETKLTAQAVALYPSDPDRAMIMLGHVGADVTTFAITTWATGEPPRRASSCSARSARPPRV